MICLATVMLFFLASVSLTYSAHGNDDELSLWSVKDGITARKLSLKQHLTPSEDAVLQPIHRLWKRSRETGKGLEQKLLQEGDTTTQRKPSRKLTLPQIAQMNENEMTKQIERDNAAREAKKEGRNRIAKQNQEDYSQQLEKDEAKKKKSLRMKQGSERVLERKESTSARALSNRGIPRKALRTRRFEILAAAMEMYERRAVEDKYYYAFDRSQKMVVYGQVKMVDASKVRSSLYENAWEQHDPSEVFAADWVATEYQVEGKGEYHLAKKGEWNPEYGALTWEHGAFQPQELGPQAVSEFEKNLLKTPSVAKEWKASFFNRVIDRLRDITGERHRPSDNVVMSMSARE